MNPAAALAPYAELMKPRPTTLAALTAVLGAFLASEDPAPAPLLLRTFLGTLLLGGGAGSLNQFFERGPDARMKRTEGRPIPGGRIAPGRALAFGILLSAAAVAYFAFFLNAAAAAIGAAALLSYVFVYTPLKRRTRLSAWVGAVPGALPPLVGWAAARGGLDPEAWSLFALLFVWQFPHFLVIGWIYREDYARAGFPVLAHADPTGRQTARQIALFSAALFAAVWLPSAAGLTGPFYTAAAAALGAAFLGMALFLAPGRLVRYAKRFAFASVVLLPLLGAAMVADRLLGAAARS